MSDAMGNALIMSLMLILPISALVARQIPLSTTVKYALAWAAVFGIGLLLARAFFT